MTRPRIFLLTTLAMIAFAGNSLLCRAALKDASIDPASFTTIRLVSGALTLWLLVRAAGGSADGRGSWPSAMALFVYAFFFSLAYGGLSAATGALILFASVQATMIAYGLRAGERFSAWQLAGLCTAAAGLVVLLIPGLTAPPVARALLMMGAGVAWGGYSLRGRAAGNPTRVTAGNFLRAALIAVAASIVAGKGAFLTASGVGLAVASGALASGMGYALWYAVLPALRATRAAVVQLSVPAIAAVGGALLLREPITLRVLLASAAIIGGIALVVLERRKPA